MGRRVSGREFCQNARCVDLSGLRLQEREVDEFDFGGIKPDPA